mmetsp:Transcript_18832/g.53953  ORF Transcript_18832/g.53953 Transcript_18832/m.53953 type:complete len:206 (+) Transcript_18832:272-889(+)
MDPPSIGDPALAPLLAPRSAATLLLRGHSRGQSPRNRSATPTQRAGACLVPRAKLQPRQPQHAPQAMLPQARDEPQCPRGARIPESGREARARLRHLRSPPTVCGPRSGPMPPPHRRAFAERHLPPRHRRLLRRHRRRRVLQHQAVLEQAMGPIPVCNVAILLLMRRGLVPAEVCFRNVAAGFAAVSRSRRRRGAGCPQHQLPRA